MKIVKVANGKETVVATGDRKKMNNRLKELKGSTKGKVSGRGGRKYKVEYKLVE